MHSEIKSLLEWLSVRPTWTEVRELIMTLFLFQLVWAFVVFSIVDISLAIEVKDSYRGANHILEQMSEHGLYGLVGIILAAAFIEEVLFRFIPLSLALLFVSLRPRATWVVLPVAVVASLIFGLVHVFNYDLVTDRAILQSVFVQGVGGMATCILFLKYTGLQLRYVVGGLLVTTAEHVLWNGFLTVIILVLKFLE